MKLEIQFWKMNMMLILVISDNDDNSHWNVVVFHWHVAVSFFSVTGAFELKNLNTFSPHRFPRPK